MTGPVLLNFNSNNLFVFGNSYCLLPSLTGQERKTCKESGYLYLKYIELRKLRIPSYDKEKKKCSQSQAVQESNGC